MSFPHKDEVLKFRETFMAWALEKTDQAAAFQKLASDLANIYVNGCKRDAEIDVGLAKSPVIVPVPRPVEKSEPVPVVLATPT